jgi:hypothetical protein
VKWVWFLAFLAMAAALMAFFMQDRIIKEIGIEDPNSNIGKKIDEAIGTNRIQHVNRAKNVGTEPEFANIRTAFVLYYSTYNEYPKSLQELVGRGMIDQGALRDYWQQGYRTEIDGTDLVLTSPGPDRIKNTKDDLSTRISLVAGGEKEIQWGSPSP